MELDLLIAMLYDKDTKQAYKNLQELEQLSDTSNALYPYLNNFYEMDKSEKYVIRVRGFRLFCKQAKWDIEDDINGKLKDVLVISNDEKPTAVRQALSALKDVVIYKRNLKECIKESILGIDYLRYKDSMQGLILKDIQDLLDFISPK